MKIVKTMLAITALIVAISAHAGQMDRVRGSIDVAKELTQLKAFYELSMAMDAINQTNHSDKCKSAAILSHDDISLKHKGNCSDTAISEWKKEWQPTLKRHSDLFSLVTRIAFLQDHKLPLPYMKIGDEWKQTNSKFIDMWRCSACSEKCVVPVKEGIAYVMPYLAPWKKFETWNFKPKSPSRSEPAPVVVAQPEPEVEPEPEPEPEPAAPEKATTLNEAMEMVYEIPEISAQCKSGIILLNAAAGGSDCHAKGWMTGKDRWWDAIGIGKDGTSFQERLDFLKARGLPIPKHQITRDTWRTPESAAQNRGVRINNVPSKDAWTYQ